MAGFLSERATTQAAYELALSETILTWASEPFDPALANCAFSVLDYVEAVTGRVASPDPRVLGRTALARLWRDGDALRGQCVAVMAGLGWPEARTAQRGDVALVDRKPGPTAAICLRPASDGSPPLWLERGTRAAMAQPGVPIVIWSMPRSVEPRVLVEAA